MIDLPVHQYVTVSPGLIHDEVQRGAWFAVQPNMGGEWGGHVLLESGALYRNIPLHALVIGPDDSPTQRPEDLQLWDCYSEEATAIEYRYLRTQVTLSRSANCGAAPIVGTYLFTLIPRNDAFSRHPEQAKEFVVSVRDDTSRLVIRATNELLFADKSLADQPTAWPYGLKRLVEVPSVEGWDYRKPFGTWGAKTAPKTGDPENPAQAPAQSPKTP
jgi:hypothetical protein